jgi:predicted acylesterase/phospholipase RssA
MFLDTARPGGLPPEVRSRGLDEVGLVAASREVMQRLRTAATDGTLDILALSGGGAGGAFGAGALVGLTRRGERPQFEVVTGVSTGALIAPFAFLGSSWDAKLTEALAGAGTGRLLQRRTVDILYRPSLYRGPPLADFVERAASDPLIDAVAREAGKGRMLLVATTDLDKESTVIWNMGTIALQNSATSRKLFRDVLVASASVPGIFPPVLIHVESSRGSFDEMHVDGGTTVPFFFAPEVAHIDPGQLTGLVGVNLYVLMNTQMGGAPETTAGRLGSIMARSFDAVLTSMSRTELQLASAFAHANAMNFRLTEIPIDYPFGGPVDFHPSAVRALFDYGERCAEQGLLWTTPAEALHRGQAAMARDGSKTNPEERTAPKDVPCPAPAPHAPASTREH